MKAIKTITYGTQGHKIKLRDNALVFDVLLDGKVVNDDDNGFTHQDRAMVYIDGLVDPKADSMARMSGGDFK